MVALAPAYGAAGARHVPGGPGGVGHWLRPGPNFEPATGLAAGRDTTPGNNAPDADARRCAKTSTA